MFINMIIELLSIETMISHGPHHWMMVIIIWLCIFISVLPRDQQLIWARVREEWVTDEIVLDQV